MTDRFAKGWCPGALRPMESGDGLIVRLKLTGGILPLSLADKIADWSARWGNGQVDLTSRANLQIRGVTTAGIEPLQDAMAAAGLLDVTPEGEAVRNVIASPLAGIDPDALLDIRAVVAALEARLASDARLHGLPAKFCWLVDDGGRLGLDDVRADVRFAAISAGAFAVGLDGSDDKFGPFSVDEVPDVAARIAVMFRLSLASRMRDHPDIVAAAKAADLKALARLSGRGWREAPGEGARDFKGICTLTLPSKATGPSLSRVAGEGLSLLGVGLPFGRISAKDLQLLANEAAERGAAALRLTPWRTILIPLPTHDSVQHLADALPSDSFILDPADPRLRVAACVGAPACPRATTDVRADASQLAPGAKPGELLHVSGCAKGCAHPRAATVTLVARDGLYDLIRNGAPWDMAQLTGLSPADLARGLNEGQAA